jgi:hypothetical protein
MELLAVAWQRTDGFIRIDGGFLVLDASARELNFSDELFSFIKAGIEGQNRIISTRAVAIPDDTLPYDPTGYDPGDLDTGGGAGGSGSPFSVLRFFGYYQSSFSLTHEQTLQFFNTTHNISNILGYGAYGTGGISLLMTYLGYLPGTAAYIALGSFIMQSLAYLTEAQWSSYETQYLNSGSNKGITIVGITVTPMTAAPITPPTI